MKYRNALWRTTHLHIRQASASTAWTPSIQGRPGLISYSPNATPKQMKSRKNNKLSTSEFCNLIIENYSLRLGWPSDPAFKSKFKKTFTSSISETHSIDCATLLYLWRRMLTAAVGALPYLLTNLLPPLIPNTAHATEQVSAFLEKLEKTIDSEMTKQNVINIFNWNVEGEYSTPAGRSIILGTGPGQHKTLNTFFYPKKITLFIQIQRDLMCIRSSDIIAKFGKNYRKTILIAHGPVNPDNDPEIADNIEKFLYGPEYSFHRNHDITRLTFDFYNDRCARSALINRGKDND